jgi:hypothetical protein
MVVVWAKEEAAASAAREETRKRLMIGSHDVG